MPPVRVARTFVLLVGLAGTLGGVGTRGPVAVAGDDEAPSLVRALFLEKTARDAAAALVVFDRVAADAGADAPTRAEARLGAARCLVALGRDAEADARWKALEDDADAPPDARERARDLRSRRAAVQRSAEETEAELRAQEAVRRAEQARQDREGRIEAARVLVESAARQVKEKRYEKAREDLIQALQLNPADERAVALLEEISAFGDRGDLLRQAIRFVATNRVLDFRRLSADVERRHKAALRLLREGRPDVAVTSLSDAVARIDESDFYADLAEARRGLVVLMRKAIEDAKRTGVALPAGTAVPADRPEAPAVKPWRSEFFGLLSRVFSTDGDGDTSLRFYDTAVPPNPAPEGRGAGFASSGVSATPTAGTLRRARFVERYVRDNVAPGSWGGRDRLLERYDDLLVVEHAAGALREVDAVVGAFPTGAPAPVRVEVRVYAATAAGVADAVRLLEIRAKPGEAGTSAVAPNPTLAEQVNYLAGSSSLVPMAQASLRLTGRHTTLLRFREPTSGCPWYAPREGPTPLVIPDKDATYGLDLDLYAEDLPGAKGFAAVSVVATVRRPERPRLLPLATGNTQVPSFLTQTVEADRKVPHAGSLALLSLANPFKANGAAGDPAGGSHPDLLVLVSVAPADGGSVPDAPPPAPAPGAGGVTREIDLGPLADVEDEPPPDDWPSAPFADPSRLDAARRRRRATARRARSCRCRRTCPGRPRARRRDAAGRPTARRPGHRAATTSRPCRSWRRRRRRRSSRDRRRSPRGARTRRGPPRRCRSPARCASSRRRRGRRGTPRRWSARAAPARSRAACGAPRGGCASRTRSASPPPRAAPRASPRRLRRAARGAGPGRPRAARPPSARPGRAASAPRSPRPRR